VSAIAQHDGLSPTLALAMALLERPSVTPHDAGCQALMMARLAALGFEVVPLPFGEVQNFWARRGGDGPLLCFAGHTDVVPAHPEEAWQSPPFTPTLREGRLYGRGAADMKGSLAAMVTACERFVAAHPDHRSSIGFLITSDEEGPARDGTRRVVEWLREQGQHIDYCLVGEPSSQRQLADVVKNGRRGSLHGLLTVTGREGHVAYPAQVQNPIHACGPIIGVLVNEVWDRGNDFFPPTSLQITNLHAGRGAVNVVPREAVLRFNFRFSSEVSAGDLQERVQTLVQTALLNEEVRDGQVYTHHIQWELSGEPFLTEPGALVEAVSGAVAAECGYRPALSTSGGTSDGRFIAPMGAQVVELGPVNASIHKVDEWVEAGNLERLSRIYQGTLARLLEI